MQLKQKTLATLLAVGCALPLASWAEGPSYTFVEGGAFRSNYDDIDINPAGYYVAGSAQIGESLFVRGLYADGDDDMRVLGTNVDFDVTDLRLGVGLKQDYSATASWFIAVDYLEPEVEAEGYSVDENGGALSIGVRSLVTNMVEVFGELGYVDIDDADGFAGNLGVVYTFYEGLGVVAKAEVDEDKNSTISAGIRYTF